MPHLGGYPVRGSSPLARGLRRNGGEPRHISGIIPARAGFTTTDDRNPPGGADHPRSRGVYGENGQDTPVRVGSSPLARGLLGVPRLHPQDLRIIPARAGFTRREPPTWRPGADHPRSRGVYRTPSVGSCSTSGSSPLARGLPRRDSGERGQVGIIPARAGFTVLHEIGRDEKADHPRSRGVYRWAIKKIEKRNGSSPLARGLRRDPMRSIAATRIIPARAGFTSRTGATSAASGDHPRSRGVYSTPRGRTRATSGSSPLARGLPDRLMSKYGI